MTVAGRVLRGGTPLAGVALGLVQRDRNADRFVGDIEYATDAHGRFAFANIPPGDAWNLYGVMDSLKPHEATPVRNLRTGTHGATVAVGDLGVQPGFRLTGRIVLADGKPVPPGTRVLLSREGAWDSQTATAGRDGDFCLTGVPAERVGLSAHVPGDHPSPRNASFDLLNQGGLLGKVGGDIEGFHYIYLYNKQSI